MWIEAVQSLSSVVGEKMSWKRVGTNCLVYQWVYDRVGRQKNILRSMYVEVSVVE